jgi:drug/metabolite transporter (DMT)-like permease
MPRHLANLLLLLAGAIWGIGFVAQSTAMQSIGPFLFIGMRFLVAALVLAPFAWREARRAEIPVSSMHLRGFVFVGLALFSAMALQQVGLTLTTVTNSGFLTASMWCSCPSSPFLCSGSRCIPLSGLRC